MTLWRCLSECLWMPRLTFQSTASFPCLLISSALLVQHSSFTQWSFSYWRSMLCTLQTRLMINRYLLDCENSLFRLPFFPPPPLPPVLRLNGKSQHHTHYTNEVYSKRCPAVLRFKARVVPNMYIPLLVFVSLGSIGIWMTAHLPLP